MAPRLLKILRDRLKFATRRSTEPAMFDFLNPIAEPKNEEVAAYLRRLTGIEALPFTAQLVECERSKAINLVLDRSWGRLAHVTQPVQRWLELILPRTALGAALYRGVRRQPSA